MKMVKLKMNEKSISMNEFIKKNLWQIIVAAAVFIWGYSMLNARVDANATALTELQIKIAVYPSADYFNLKFQNLTDKMNALQLQVDKLTK